MTSSSVRLRLFLALSAGLFLASGILFAARRGSLPYGDRWPAWLGGCLAVSLLPLGRFFRVRRLASRLTTPRELRLVVERLPRKPEHTYLGEGFLWGPAESRRLLELSVQGIELPADLQGAIGGDWLLHGLGAARTGDLFLPDHLLNQHLFLMGAPGSGKTRGLEVLIEQAVRRGDAVVVIDPKGDEGLLDRTYDSAVRRGRGGEFRLLALPHPHFSARYNPLEFFISPSDVADRICSIMPRGGEGEAFRNYAWQFVSTVATALHRIGEKVSLARLEEYCIHDTWTLVRRMMEKVCPEAHRSSDHETLVRGYRAHCTQRRATYPELDQLIAMALIERQYFGKIAGALRTVLAKLTSSTVGYLLCPDDLPPPEDFRGKDAPPTLSWKAIDEDRLVVYFFLGSLIGPDSAQATARMCLADLMSYVGRKYAFDDASKFSKRRLTVIVDEVADALAPESVNILNKARGAGLSVVMAGQSLADLEVALGSGADARRALANVGSFLTFRAANPDDARFFSEKVGVRPIPVLTRGEQYQPTLLGNDGTFPSDFVYRSSSSTSLRNDYLLPTSSLDRLARFHFFGLWGGELRKGVLPLLDPPRHRYSPILKGGVGGEGEGAAA
jgi:conjugal transfer pilus assembly protein TraD